MVEWLVKVQQQLSLQQRLINQKDQLIENKDQQISAQLEEIEKLKEERDKLKNRDSKNSSVPPSSDQLKKPSDNKKPFYKCPICGWSGYSHLPLGVKEGFSYGARLSSIVGWRGLRGKPDMA
jgi:hypothetical protein